MTERSAPTSSVKIAKPTSMLSNLFSAASLEKFARELKPEEFIVKKRVREEIPEISETGSKETEEKEKGPKKREGKKKKWDEARRIEVDALKASGEWKKICDANNAAAVSNQGNDVHVTDKKDTKADATVAKLAKSDQKGTTVVKHAKSDAKDVTDVKHAKSDAKTETAVDNSNESDPTDDSNPESLGPIVTDGSRDAFTVFLGNVPKAETAKTLKKYCVQFGEVESVRLRSIPVAGTAVDDAGNQKLVRRVCAISRNFADVKGSFNAYVVFKTKEAVEAALEANNRLLGTRHLRVDRSHPTLFDPKKSVFVGSLPHYADEEDVRNHFAAALPNGHDDIEAVRLVRDPETLIGKGIGYLLFKDRDSVLLALALHESIFKKRNLRVTVCGKTSKRIKQIAKGEDVSKNFNFNHRAKIAGVKRPQDNSGSASVKGKREDKDEPDAKKARPAFMSRKSDDEMTLNEKNANKRINLKSANTRNKTLVANGQKKATPGKKGKRLGGVVKRAMKAAGTPKKK